MALFTEKCNNYCMQLYQLATVAIYSIGRRGEEAILINVLCLYKYMVMLSNTQGSKVSMTQLIILRSVVVAFMCLYFVHLHAIYFIQSKF